MSELFFSVIVPTHQRPILLQRLLTSLSEQSIDPKLFEIIVVATANDPAYNLTPPEKLSANYRIVTVPEDPTMGRSASAKRNYGAQLAQAPWLAMIDDDCVADSQWLANAKIVIDNQNCQGVEGHTIIPIPEKKTLTYKGIQRLSQPGGYQTCNIFYRKKEFIELGGFDLNFPFYLEDTDWAWTLIESGGKMVFGPDVKVEHPVPPPEPRRLLDNAIRMRKLPYLAKKHPTTYKNSRMRAFPRPYVIFLFFDFLFVVSLFFCSWTSFFWIAFLRIALTFVYLTRMFKGVHWTWKELGQTFYYSLIGPVISFFQLMRGNFEQNTFLFLR